MAIRKINLKGKLDCNSVEVHITIPVWLYKQVYVYQCEADGQPGLSGLAVTGLRHVLDMAGYLKSPKDEVLEQ